MDDHDEKNLYYLSSRTGRSQNISLHKVGKFVGCGLGERVGPDIDIVGVPVVSSGRVGRSQPNPVQGVGTDVGAGVDCGGALLPFRVGLCD